MRLMMKTVMMAVLFIGGLNYAAYLYTGRSLLPVWLEKTQAMLVNVRQGASDSLDSLKEQATADVPPGQVIYKWTNADGVPQYSNDPPPEGVNARIVQVDSNANLIRAVSLPESAPEPPSAAQTGSGDGGQAAAGPDKTFPFSPEQVKKTMEDAREARQSLNEGMEQQRRILENL